MNPVSSVSAVLSRTNPPITLTKLNSNCFIYNPPTSSTPTSYGSPSAPTTILVLAWMDAAAKHIAKYVATYAALYPHARIIVGTMTTPDYFKFSEAARQKQFAPILFALTDDPAPSPKLLVHLFSNGGVKSLYALSLAHLTKTGSPLTPTLLVADSGPGRPHLSNDIHVLMRRMPKNPVLWVLQYVVTLVVALVILFVYHYTPFWYTLVRGPREHMIDPKQIAIDCRYCYIYSMEDRLIVGKDVEDHAKSAEEVGYKVEKHRFVGSQHVSHMRLDEGKYWTIVAEAWETALTK